MLTHITTRHHNIILIRNEQCFPAAHVDKNEIIEDMYKTIKNQIIEEKSKNSTDPFIKDWIHHQETMYFEWKEKQELKRKMASQGGTEECETENPADTDKIPKVTILEPKPKLTKKQIEEGMAKMDPVKRERWQNWFFQCEFSKTTKQPIFISDLRKDFKRIIEPNGHESLVQHYKTELANLKENVRISVEKIDKIMSQLEAKEPKSQSEANKFEPQDEVEIDPSGQKSDSSEVSGVSEERRPLTEQEICELEEHMYKKILVPPNAEKIQELLNVEIVYPEKPPEIVKLGRSKDEAEKSGLESKGLECYITRILYFFQYKTEHDANFVRSEYEKIVKNVVIATESDTGTNKGCLLIYENVYMAIVMVEGAEFEILKHLSRFQRTDLYSSIKQGKVLYIHQFLVKTYFNKWVVRVENPPVGKITYLTKSKKVMYRTAASRVARVSEMLHKLYKHVVKEEKYLVDPRSVYTKSKYIILLPSPALFAYLFKYKILRDLKIYLDDLGKPLDIESDDEQLFAFTEDAIYSNYVDSDHDEEIKKAKLNYAKAVVQENGAEHRKKIKEMNDLRLKDTGEVISWDDFYLDEITSTVVDGRIKMADDPNHPAVRLGAAIEERQNKIGDGEKKPSKYSSESDFSKPGEFLRFVEKGKLNWHQQLKKWQLRSGLGFKLDYIPAGTSPSYQQPEMSATGVKEEYRKTESDLSDSDTDFSDSFEHASETSSSDECLKLSTR